MTGSVTVILVSSLVPRALPPGEQPQPRWPGRRVGRGAAQLQMAPGIPDVGSREVF